VKLGTAEVWKVFLTDILNKMIFTIPAVSAVGIVFLRWVWYNYIKLNVKEDLNGII